MTADKSTANFSFFYFFFRTGTTGPSLLGANNCSKRSQQYGCTWLQLAISCVNEQLFVIPNSSRPETADAAGMTRAQGEQLFRTRQAA